MSTARLPVPDNPDMIRHIWAYIRLTHPWAVAVVMTATALFGLLATGGDPPPGRFLLLLAGMLGGQIAIGASNEWMDRHADALDKPERPIPSGLVSPSGTLRFAGAGLAAMAAAGIAVGLWGFLLLAAGTGAGLLYNVWLKRTPLSWLPYLVALPLLPTWVWLVMDAFQPDLLWLYPLGAAFVLAIHLSQTLPDISADGLRGEQGIGVVIGQSRAGMLVWSAALASTAAVAAGGLLAGESALPSMLAAGIVTAVLAGTMAGMRMNADRLRPHLFKVLTACAVILATGWILTVTG